MENKYYTPSIEEFHVGLEFEWFEEEDWKKDKFICNSQFGFTFDDMPELANQSRVKYLDREDIESLGWIHMQTKSIGKDHYEGLFTNSTRGKMLFEHDWLNNKITIKSPNWIRDGSGKFDGYIIYINRLIINNKSELIKLMKQLGINE